MWDLVHRVAACLFRRIPVLLGFGGRLRLVVDSADSPIHRFTDSPLEKLMKSSTLILGIGNVLMGDEGVGVEVARRLETLPLPDGVECLDGGTGSFVLLGPMQQAGRVILVDATAGGSSPGTVTRLEPRFSKDYPKALTAHDIGLKDLLDAFHLLGDPPPVTLFAVSIDPPVEVGMGLTPPVAAAVPEVVRMILGELAQPFVDPDRNR
jgi:hydrogenase maturation protease